MARLTLANFRTPLKILDAVFRDGEDLKFLDVPGFPPILFLRDPELIREITVETSNNGDFERDTLPTQGIGRVVGSQNLLYLQGADWKEHKAAAVRPLGTRAVQTVEVFHDLEQTIYRVTDARLEQIADLVRASPTGAIERSLEPDIQELMLNLLVHVLFGADVPDDELRDRYLPAIRGVIRYILLDTLLNQFHLPVLRLPALTPGHARIQRDWATFEELVDRVIAARDDGHGFWPYLTINASPEAIRSNVRVFLAGALEATSSYLSWILVNLARNPTARQRAYEDVSQLTCLSPQSRQQATYLHQVMSESLRLNNSLYFLPRIALREATVATSRGSLTIPAGTHLVLATWHMNRCEDHWGTSATGYPASEFIPERWNPENLARHGRSSKDNLHFGFGHGPRVCIGKHFSEAEAFVCLAMFLRRFDFEATGDVAADSGISTRPADQVRLTLRLRPDPAFTPRPAT